MKSFILRRLFAAAWIAISCVCLFGCGEGGKDSSGVGGFFVNLTAPKPNQVARDAFNLYDADKRRRAVVLLSNADWGGEEPYLKTYRLLVDDADPTVRAACLTALALHGGPEDVTIILHYVNDELKIVRWEAVKALQRLHNEDAVQPLIKTLSSDQDVDVRIAAANALGQYPQRKVFDALVGGLIDDDYGVVLEAEKALNTITGQYLGIDSSKWMEWAKHTDDLFAQSKRYYYPQYQKPASLVDKAKFWKKPEMVIPQEPRGIEGSGSEEAKYPEKQIN